MNSYLTRCALAGGVAALGAVVAANSPSVTAAPAVAPQSLSAPSPTGLAPRLVADKGKATQVKVGALVIDQPWIRATPGGAKVAGGYLKITNTGKEPDRLVGGSLPIAGDVEVHEMAMSGNVMKMRRLAEGLEIKPGQSVELKPGGYHLMFTGLRETPKAGQILKGTLAFQKAGTVEVHYQVAPIGAQSPKGGKKSGGHGGHGH